MKQAGCGQQVTVGLVVLSLLLAALVEAAPVAQNEDEHTKIVYVVLPDSVIQRVAAQAMSGDTQHSSHELLGYLENAEAGDDVGMDKRRYLPSKRRYLFT